jgi:hypothetical protein
VDIVPCIFSGDVLSSMPFPVEIPQEEQNDLKLYTKTIRKAQKAFEESIGPVLERYFPEYEEYTHQLKSHSLDVNYSNPMIHTRKNEYFLYMLLIEYSNQYWKPTFDKIPLQQKIIVLPRCITGPEFNMFEVKRSKEGWHRITGCKVNDCSGWKLTQLGKKFGFHVYITMGNRFKEPNFLRVFRNLHKKFGNFGLIAVACIPELAFGHTYIMEMGIPSQAVPLFYSGCAKWHGTRAIQTQFPLEHIRQLLGI